MGKLYRMPLSHSHMWLRLLPLFGIFALTLALVLSINAGQAAQTLSLKQGSYGDQVKSLQQELQRQGFYSGHIDGVYGANTTRAVRTMQQQYGLKADGVAGPDTLRALGIDGSPTSASTGSTAPVLSEAVAGATDNAAASSLLNADDITLLARAIHAEAADEPYIGKVAVGAVLLNRMNHADFPNTLPGVIYQALAFASVTGGSFNAAGDEESLRAAKDAAVGYDPTYGCLYFWNPSTDSGAGVWARRASVSYGNLVFGI